MNFIKITAKLTQYIQYVLILSSSNDVIKDVKPNEMSSFVKGDSMDIGGRFTFDCTRRGYWSCRTDLYTQCKLVTVI